MDRAPQQLPAPDDFYWEAVSKNIGVYSEREQQRLRDARVVLFGLGGVGGMQALLCARMGIGHLTGVDHDEFEISNLNRQMIATTDNLGRSKAEATEQAVRAINPYLSTCFVRARVDEDNASSLIDGGDIVIEAVDDMPSRVIIHRTARELGIPSVGMSGSPPNRGFVSSFFPDGVHYEDVLNLPGKGRKLTDPDLRRQIAEIKKARARYSVGLGAPAGWAEAFCAGKAGWIITPARAVMIATFSFHEVTQILTGREPLARAPKAVLIDLDSPAPARVAHAPEGGWDYSQL